MVEFIEVIATIVFSTIAASIVINFLLKSIQQDFMGTPLELRIGRAATSVRQLSEWGMRQIQGKFPRMLDKMRYEERGERRIILNLTVLLYNYSCSKIGQNQILSTYMHDRINYFGTLEPIPAVAEIEMFRYF